MKISILHLLLLAIALCIPQITEAKIIRATLFPNSAQIEEFLTLTPTPTPDGHGIATFTIPIQADPASLSIRIKDKDVTVTDLSWARTERKDTDAIKKIVQELAQLARERDAQTATLMGIDGQIEFWKSLRAEGIRKTETAQELAQDLGAHIERLYVSHFEAKSVLLDTEKRIKELEEKLEELAGKTAKSWKIKLTLGNAGESVKAECSYRINECGWTPKYRLEALPGKKKVRLHFDAEIRQSSGRDWNAEVLLATLPAHTQLTPPDIPAWNIRPRPEAVPLAKSAAPQRTAAFMAEADFTEKTTAIKEARATYSVWSLGKRTVSAGPPQLVPISMQKLDAEFSYLARPALTDKCFLQAHIKLPETADMPEGVALFIVDGAILAKRPFSMKEKEKTLFFGSDPQVLAKSETIARQSGEKGVFGSKQTFQWKWKVKLKNNKPYPVRVSLEEPKPISGDKRIELKTVLTPRPDKETRETFEWEVDLAPETEQAFGIVIDMQAPDDLKLDLGWR